MSELLRLREWLSFAEAQRYMSLLGIKARKKDFFIAYASADMPMKLLCQDSPFYSLVREKPEKGFPHCLIVQDEQGDTYKTDSGTVYPAEPELMVATSKRQDGYSESSVVWVNDPSWYDADC